MPSCQLDLIGYTHLFILSMKHRFPPGLNRVRTECNSHKQGFAERLQDTVLNELKVDQLYLEPESQGNECREYKHQMR